MGTSITEKRQSSFSKEKKKQKKKEEVEWAIAHESNN